jgi:PST family polysaccharide transporter
LQHLFLSDLPRLARVFVAGVICAATYLAVIVGVFGVTAPLQLAYSLLRDFAPTRLRRSS